MLKPAPETPYSATWIAKLVAEETDIPAGVLNVVTSADRAQSARCSPAVRRRHDLVHGIHRGRQADSGPRRGDGSSAFLELGGKSANIVLDDADFPAALGAGMVCMHSGQGCAITTRMLLPRSRYDEGIELVKASFESFPYGDPTDIANMADPLIIAPAQARSSATSTRERRKGALHRRRRPGDTVREGRFVQPTLFVDVDPSATIAREEIFGPVLVVIPYEDDDARSASPATPATDCRARSRARRSLAAMAVARRIRTGTVSVNGSLWFGPDSPFRATRRAGKAARHESRASRSTSKQDHRFASRLAPAHGDAIGRAETDEGDACRERRRGCASSRARRPGCGAQWRPSVVVVVVLVVVGGGGTTTTPMSHDTLRPGDGTLIDVSRPVRRRGRPGRGAGWRRRGIVGVVPPLSSSAPSCGSPPRCRSVLQCARCIGAEIEQAKPGSRRRRGRSRCRHRAARQ